MNSAEVVAQARALLAEENRLTLIAEGEALIAQEGKPKTLCLLANAGDHGEAVLQTMPREDYTLAKYLGKIFRLKQVLAREGVSPERQRDRESELQKIAGQVVVAMGLKEGLKTLAVFGVEVN